MKTGWYSKNKHPLNLTAHFLCGVPSDPWSLQYSVEFLHGISRLFSLQALAKELGLSYVETSAKTAERVEEAFDQMARLL